MYPHYNSSEQYKADRTVYDEYTTKRHNLYKSMERRKHPAKRFRSLQNNVIFKL